jgi:uncharacterized phage protein gp47/JayE
MITIPTLSELYNSIVSDIETKLGVTLSTTGKVYLRVLAGVQAAKLKLYYLAIGNLQKNIFVDTAESESIGGTLERFGRVKLGRNPFPAVAGQYIVVVTGTAGAVINAQTTFKSDDASQSPGYLFILDNAYTLTGSNDTITLRALTAGIESKLSLLDTLTATTPIALVESGVYVQSESVEPRNAEDLEVYRTAVINAYQLEAQGGAATDYRLWSADAQGVRFVYPYAKSGFTNQVDLFVEATIADSVDGKGTPTAGILTDVEAVVNFDPDTTKALTERGRRPLTTIVNYLAIVVKEIDIEIVGYVNSTPSIETTIEGALEEMINEVRPFVAAADILANKNDILDTNKIIATILNAQPGSIFTQVILRVDSVQVSTYTFDNGNIPYFNSVTFS